jgi:hypothetical protein
MTVTKHAEQRIRQRGFRDLQLKLIEVFGEEVKQPGGAMLLGLTRKRKAEIVQALDKAINKALIMSENGETLITVINRG